MSVLWCVLDSTLLKDSVLWCVLDSTLFKDSVLWCVLVQRCLRLSKVYDPIGMKKFSESICLVITMAFKKTKILEDNRRRKQIRGGVDISDHDRELSQELPRRCRGVCLIRPLMQFQIWSMFELGGIFC